MRIDFENARYVRVGDFAVRRVAGEAILVPFRGRSADLSHIFQLNEVAAFVWNALESPAGVEDLVRLVTAAFEVEEVAAKRDVHRLLESLESAGLVRAEGTGA